MIGDKSKSSKRDIETIGAVLNRSLEFYLNKGLDYTSLNAKSKNFNDKEEIIDKDEIYLDSNSIGLYPYELDIKSTSNITLDLNMYSFFKINLNKDIIIEDIINPKDGCEYVLLITQDSIGDRTIKFGSELPIYISQNNEFPTEANSIYMLKIRYIFEKFYCDIEIIK